MINLLPRLEFIFQAFVKDQEFCPHCQSKSLVSIAKKYSFVKIKKCIECELCFTAPIYKSWLVSNLYNFIYSADGGAISLPSYEQLNTLKKNSFASSDICFADRIKSIKSISPGQKILEIGSSWGYFLYQARQQGYEVTGLEISEERRTFGVKELGINIVEYFKELREEKFDIIYTSHVLEHFTDLSTIFSDVYYYLNNKGKLIIEVPNFDFSQFGDSTLSLIGAVHPLGFASIFFQKNLPKYGFNILGFYDSWDSFPENKREKSSQNVIILVAEKSSDSKIRI